MNQVADISSQIEILVETSWLAEHQASQQGKYAFAYHITIINNSQETVQLLNRYWLITDGNGKQSEVAGAGVVGETPVLEPGQRFSYRSGAVLDTPLGFMQGHYELCRHNEDLNEDQQLFKAPIEMFTLNVPNTLN